METKDSFEDNDNGNNNTQLEPDTAILLSILPSNVWAYTFKKLEKKHQSSLENLSNSSLFFRDVILSKRVLFLFPQVIKLIGPEFASQTNTRNEGSNITKSRIICKQWNKAVDQFIIDSTLEPDFFNSQTPLPSDHALVNARYQYFSHVQATKLARFLAHFEQTHLPHSSRNPFIGKIVHIDVTGFTIQNNWATIADQVSTLLRKYGHHIKILNFGTFIDHYDHYIRLENHHWLLECLRNCPNVTHLKVFQRFNPHGETDVAFGELPDPRRRPVGYLHGLQMREHRAPPWEGVPLPVDAWYENMMRQDALDQLGHHRHHRHVPLPQPMPEPEVPPNPTVTLKNLKCLKLNQLSAENFNALIFGNTHVVWLQVEPWGDEKRRYIDYLALEFPNLKKLYIKLCSPEEVRKLRNVHSSWLSLTDLHFEYCVSSLCCISPDFTEWIEIFGVINQKWGNTLRNLKLRLPMAIRREDKDKISRDSGYFRLYLPRLQRLKIWLSERPGEGRVAKTEFLDLLRVGLEQLIIE